MRTTIILCLCLTMISTESKAQKDGGILIKSDFSIDNKNPEFTFYIKSYFTIGRGPRITGYQIKKSNDTLYIFGFYDFRGALTLSGSRSTDTLHYYNTDPGINYFTISTNSFTYCEDSDGYIIESCNDTTWNHYDSTFGIHPTSIKTANSLFSILVLYPNPSSQYINIQNNDWQELMVYNSIGQFVLRSHKTIQQNEQLDIRNLPSGHYIINFYDRQKNRIGSGRFYKQSE